MYLNDWKETGREGMQRDFGIKDSDLEGVEVLLATYTYEDYDGSAFVLFRKNGKLYEVHGSHCSCYGLSEQDYCGDTRSQWVPEETTVEAVRKQLENDSYRFDGAREEMRQMLDAIAA